ncbi:amino acid ABC transporter permease [Kerstersia similis]|uniref:amino acid ABC transporter permease n=1 Tax=Kerstersia similis TaxID=206505 RepID=UPI0039F122EF
MDFSVVANNWLYFLVGAYPYGPLGGLSLTLLLSLLSGVVASILGLLLGMALALGRGPLHGLLTLVIGFLRAIPVLMLIFWVYFLLPMLFDVDIPKLVTVVAALSLIGGAYLAHSVAAGIRSLPAGQWEASRSLGLSLWETLRFVVLPQALPIMAPSFINQWVALIKDTSLAYVVGVAELSFVATQVSNRTMIYPLEIYLFVAFVYFLLCSALEMAANRMAARYGARHARTGSSAA